ncbi:MAG: nucleotide exchange factor GrpE [Anaerolineales bacterium]|nr:nucleotide exchange factor GrpE [Anaerolineales bacterium]
MKKKSKDLEKDQQAQDAAPLPGELDDQGAAREEPLQPEQLSAQESKAGDEIPLEEKLALTQAALETSEAKAGEYLEGWQRAQAEFSNYRKRMERERELNHFESVGRVIKRYLPVVDDLERALKGRPTEGPGAVWAEGIELIYRKLLKTLEAEGVTPIEAEGELFDPNLHEAVVQTPSDAHQSGEVIEVLQRGYRLGERVLRPAMVRVAA